MKRLLAFSLLSALLPLSGCPDTTTHSQWVSVLLESSGTKKKEAKKAHAIIKHLLETLKPGDSLAGLSR
jgi:hypothetical protein